MQSAWILCRLPLQLLGEPLSRLNACNTTDGWRLFDHRWVPRMETKVLKPHHWRKSWQVHLHVCLAYVARPVSDCLLLPAAGQQQVPSLLAAVAVPWLQWFALGRRHVDLVLSDTAVDASFRAHCRTMFEQDRGAERECYSGGLPIGPCVPALMWQVPA